MDLKLKNNNSLIIESFSKVEYIENTGYPDINTGLYVSSTHYNYKIDAVIDIISVSDKKATIFGSWVNTTILQQGLMCQADSTTQFTAACRWASTRYLFNISTEDTGILNIEQTPNYTKINGVTYNRTGSASTGDNNYPFKILSKYDANHGTAVVRIYSLKIYENDILLKDFIPVISYKPGHEGEACLYDTVTDKYYYSSSTGTFSTPYQAICPIITTAYIKDCPNVSGINLLRDSMNLTRVRVDIGTQSGTMAELLKYASYSGFNDDYEQQTKPRIIGNFTVTDYWTNAQVAQLSTVFDGLTISYDSEKCIDDLLDNGDIAIQTLDNTKANYNPGTSIALKNKGYGITLETYPYGQGRWFITKTQAAAITGSVNFKSITTLSDSNKIVSDTVNSYSFQSFKELKYFTGITSTSFQNSSNMQYVEFPSSITSWNANIFSTCNTMKECIFNSNVNEGAIFNNCTTTNNSNGLRVYLHGNLTVSANSSGVYGFKGYAYYIYGNQTSSNASVLPKHNIHRVKGDLSFTGTPSLYMFYNGTNSFTPYFIEVIGDVVNTTTNSKNIIGTSGNCNVMHLGKDGLVSVNPTLIPISKIVKVYVGDGSSKTSDEDVFDLYNADTNWAAYCGSGVPGAGKVDLWWNYNGSYRTYMVDENLTNVTNSNTIAWPYITRGESYQTTIVPDEGMTLDSVTVEMYEAVDDGVTPNTPTDITSSVYDSTTGEINIPSVTGNVIITATAS